MERSPAKPRIVVKIRPARHGKQTVKESVVLKNVVTEPRQALVLARAVAASNERFARIFIRTVLGLNGLAAVAVSMSECQAMRTPFD